MLQVVDLLGHITTPQRDGAAPAGDHGDVLLAVGFPGHRRGDDARTGLELPQDLAGLGVGGLQVAFRRAPEHQVAGGGQHATPQRGLVLDFPDDLAGLRVDRTQRADVAVVDGLDGEAGAQVGRTLLVGDRLVPDLHAPLVGRDVEELGLRRVGHRHLVLAAQEAGGREHDRALLAVRASRRVARAVFGDVVGTTGLQVDAGGPGLLLDEGEGVQQLAGLRVIDVEEAVAVGLAADAAAVHVEGHELVDAVEVPAVVRGVLVVPDDLAGLDVDGDGRARVQVVALTDVAVPRRRVAGAEVGQAGLGVVGAAQPGSRAAGLPQVARPGLVGRAGDTVLGLVARLVVGVAHVAFDHRADPDQRAGLGIAGLDAAHHAEFAAGHAGQHQAASDQGSGRVAVAVLVVVDLLAPDDFTGVLVQGDQLGVQGAEDHQVVVQGGAAVDHVAAGHDAFGQAVLVLPQALAGQGVQRVDARVGRGDEHLALVDHGLGFLAALLFAAEGEGPGRGQILDGGGVDLGQRAVTLAFRAQAPAQDVARGLGVIQDHLVGDSGLCTEGGKGHTDQDGGGLQLHGDVLLRL